MGEEQVISWSCWNEHRNCKLNEVIQTFLKLALPIPYIWSRLPPLCMLLIFNEPFFFKENVHLLQVSLLSVLWLTRGKVTFVNLVQFLDFAFFISVLI